MRIFGEKMVDPLNNSRLQEFDNMFKIPIGITVAHHEIHEGCSFVSDIVDESMGDNDTLSLAFKTPNTTKRVHMIVETSLKGAGHIEIDEGGTWDVGSGTQNPIYNRDRNSTEISTLLENTTSGPFIANNAVILNASSYGAGTIIHDFYVFGEKKLGGQLRDVEEIILKKNQTYMVIATADAGTNGAQITLNWYEHVSV